MMEQTSIIECLIKDENSIIVKAPNGPPPPPPPPPIGLPIKKPFDPLKHGGFNPLEGLGTMPKKIVASDLLAGMQKLKKAEPNQNKEKPLLKPKGPKGYQPPSLFDILNTLKNLKKSS